MGLDLAPSGWRALNASVAGSAHARTGHPCADASAVRVVSRRGEGSLLVAVAADGAGSAARGHEGARLACGSIVTQAADWVRRPRDEARHATRGGGRGRSHGRSGARRGSRASRTLAEFARPDVAVFVERARGRLEAAARRDGLAAREFSCTLLVALVDAEGAVFFQIGDGAIVCAGRDGRYRPALWPQSGEYANSTFFLTDADAAARVQAARVPDVHELALLTDGLQGLALRFARREAHGPFFAPMFERLRRESCTRPRRLAGELRRFLDSPAVNQRTDDDKTLVLATRLSAAPGGAAGPRV
jgi:hypothetical protein